MMASLRAVGLDGQAGPVRSPQSFTSTTTAILVDVVVRDRNGRPVTDLNGPDFDVAEDGALQKVDTFTRVSHGGGIGVGVAWKSPGSTVSVTPAATPPSQAPAAGLQDDATTALVFDHLSSESLRLAQRATLDYVPMNGESSVQVAVFATEPRMRRPALYERPRAGRQAVARVSHPASPSRSRRRIGPTS
jgi:hypothetical protein